MISVFEALARAFRDLFNLRVLWVVIWPLLAASVLWLALGWLFWETISGWIAAGLAHLGILDWLDGIEPRWIANGVQALLHLMLYPLLIVMTALLITALFAMPALIRVVAERDYPDLERASGGGFAGSLVNALIAIVLFAGIWLLTLPLWLLGIGVIVPFIAAAWLNQRLFRYDAIAEHARRDEMQTLFKQQRAGWWGLGLLTGLVQWVPLLNLLGPVLAALAFIHYGLARVQALRLRPPPAV